VHYARPGQLGRAFLCPKETHMTLVHLLVILVIVGIVMALVPIDAQMKKIIIIVVAVIVGVVLLSMLGVV
jgi:hypothetical protein